jgi:hypothetical protein
VKVKGHNFCSNKKDQAWCSCSTWSCVLVQNPSKKHLRSLWESHLEEVRWHAGIGRTSTA